VVGKCNVKVKKKQKNKMSKIKKLSLALGIVLLLSGAITWFINANNKSDGSSIFTDEELKHYSWHTNDIKQTPYDDSSSEVPTILDKVLQDNKKQIM
jgi:hypothetical protein